MGLSDLPAVTQRLGSRQTPRDPAPKFAVLVAMFTIFTLIKDV